MFLCRNRSGTPNPTSGMANAAMLILNPNSAIIHAVSVVPTLAPMMTAIDCPSDSKPATTKQKGGKPNDSKPATTKQKDGKPNDSKPATEK